MLAIALSLPQAELSHQDGNDQDPDDVSQELPALGRQSGTETAVTTDETISTLRSERDMARDEDMASTAELSYSTEMNMEIELNRMLKETSVIKSELDCYLSYLNTS